MTLAVHLVKRLSVGFALDVSFRAERGVTILFGASGSGKTTILRCVAGLARPDAGRVAIGDRMLFDSDAGVDVPVPARRIGYVFQQLALFPHMTVAQNIGYGLDGAAARASGETRVAEAADSFRISRPARPAAARRSPAASGSGRRWRARSSPTRTRCCSTSRCRRSTTRFSATSWTTSGAGTRRGASRCSTSPTATARRSRSASGSSRSNTGGSLASGSPHEVLDHPAQAPLAALAGFENLFDATVTARRERAGTMTCLLAGTTTELEVPLGVGRGRRRHPRRDSRRRHPARRPRAGRAQRAQRPRAGPCSTAACRAPRWSRRSTPARASPSTSPRAEPRRSACGRRTRLAGHQDLLVPRREY